jgi:hypothetical protein
MAPARSYNDDEVRAIIDRALRTETSAGASSNLSHEQLVALGSEIGLSPETIERAARDVEESGKNTRLSRRVLERRRRWFINHAWAFAAVNSVLFAINFLTTPGQWWVLFPVVVWGLALLLHARFGLSSLVSTRALRKEGERLRAEEESLKLESSASPRLRVPVPELRTDEASLQEERASDVTDTRAEARRTNP